MYTAPPTTDDKNMIKEANNDSFNIKNTSHELDSFENLLNQIMRQQQQPHEEDDDSEKDATIRRPSAMITRYYSSSRSRILNTTFAVACLFGILLIQLLFPLMYRNPVDTCGGLITTTLMCLIFAYLAGDNDDVIKTENVQKEEEIIDRYPVNTIDRVTTTTTNCCCCRGDPDENNNMDERIMEEIMDEKTEVK